MDGIYKISGREHPFSNYYPATATYEGVSYSTGEGVYGFTCPGQARPGIGTMPL